MNVEVNKTINNFILFENYNIIIIMHTKLVTF